MTAADDRVAALLRRIEARTVAASAHDRLTERIGPFLACAHPSSDMIWLSYAIPLSGERAGADVPGAVARLRAWFAARGRRLRFEILEPLWPDLAPQLLACGVEPQGRMPIMLCAPGDLRPPAAAGLPAGLAIADLDAASGEGELAGAAAVARRAFGEPDAAAADDVARMRAGLAGGTYRTAVARLDGRIVAVGSLSVGNDELVGIGTEPAYRGRGIGAAISHHLAAGHFAGGAELAWLSAGDDAARRVYARIGFGAAGDQVNMMDP